MSTELAIAYLRERYPARLFVPLAGALAAIGWVAVTGREVFAAPRSLGAAVVVAYCLVLAFRVWDDLEDRGRDAVEHPERVLVRAGTRAPFIALLAASSLAAAIVIAVGPASERRLAILVASGATLFIWYRVRRRAIGAPVILAKYPVIAFVAAPVATMETTVLFALSVLVPTYLTVLIYELIDESRLRRPLS